MKFLFASIILIHGAIHLMGFAKAFGYGNIPQLTKDISKTSGMLWLGTAALFSVAAVMFLLKKENFFVLAIIAVIVSQILIITTWKDARFGTIVNVIIVLVIIPAWGSYQFESQFRRDVRTHLERTNALTGDIITEVDLQPLPAPVQQYLRITGAVGKPKVTSVRLVFDGEMRGKGKDWFKFRSVQYNYFDEPTRLFFMQAKMFGMPVPGYHRYQQGQASMRVKLLGLFTVMQAEGPAMNKAETVTLFNDMCLMAPATLIDKRIEWESIDNLSTKATFNNGANSISATLYFNEIGQLTNFISDDRYEINDMKQYRFSTPVKNYKQIEGRTVPTYGETIWHYPEGEFVYGQFYLSDIEYNPTDYKP
jgi:hypothetical protein